MIINDVIAALEEGRSPILLTERTDHLEYRRAITRCASRRGAPWRDGRAKATREVFARMVVIPADAERVVLATGRYIGEGFDARLDTLFLTLPVSRQGKLIQYAGRLHRLRPGKRDVPIFDYVDLAVPMLAAMFKAREANIVSRDELLRLPLGGGEEVQARFRRCGRTASTLQSSCSARTAR